MGDVHTAAISCAGPSRFFKSSHASHKPAASIFTNVQARALSSPKKAGIETSTVRLRLCARFIDGTLSNSSVETTRLHPELPLQKLSQACCDHGSAPAAVPAD